MKNGIGDTDAPCSSGSLARHPPAKRTRRDWSIRVEHGEITRSGLALCDTSAFVSTSYTFLRAHPFQHRLPPETSQHRRKIGAEQRHQPSRAGGDIMDAHPITRSRPLRSAHEHATRMGVHPPRTIFSSGTRHRRENRGACAPTRHQRSGRRVRTQGKGGRWRYRGRTASGGSSALHEKMK